LILLILESFCKAVNFIRKFQIFCFEIKIFLDKCALVGVFLGRTAGRPQGSPVRGQGTMWWNGDDGHDDLHM